SKTILHKQDTLLKGAHITLRDLPIRLLNVKKALFEQLKSDLNREALRVIVKQKEALAGLASTMELLKPNRTMARGFSIVRMNGVAIRDAKSVKTGDILNIELHKGQIETVVK
ncbi:MAG TPA: hypothetical protein EYN67_11670, partial [Flavobacteriales bacterium]|nr:hypothetical protein [Flavobacteriales bacterium]